MASVYWLSWETTNFYGSPQQFVLQGERVAHTMNEIHGKISADSIVAMECKLIISMESYSIQKGLADNVHRMETLFANLAHTNALFLMVMFVTFVGITFAIFQMASAYENDKPHQNQIEIEGASIKLKTGYVSLGVAVIGMIALALYLPIAHEVKLLENLKSAEIEFDTTKFFEYCQNQFKK